MNRKVSLDLIGLADQGDARADRRHVQDGSAFAPRRGIVSPEENEDGERLAQDQRGKGDRAPRGTTEKIPIMSDEEDNPGADQQRAKNCRKNEAEAAGRLGVGGIMTAKRLRGLGRNDALVYKLRKLRKEPPKSGAVRRAHRRKEYWRRGSLSSRVNAAPPGSSIPVPARLARPTSDCRSPAG